MTMQQVKIALLAAVVLAGAAIAADITLTTNAGKPIDEARNSDTVGSRGPILLQDSYLLERLQIHNRERIPERNVHARGAVAKGYFESTRDWSHRTLAKVFTGGNKKTEMACRWSSVIHGLGSPEFLRDPRGFAVKLYTEEGNYDIVGLNFPVFFIRDGIRFPEMIRSLKPSPKSGVQEWWRIWDYFSHFPESLHMFTWLLDDVGIPQSYREVDGWGVHTYKWINQAGNSSLVRYYWKSHQGVVSLMDDEAVKMPFSNHTFDLYENIRVGRYPEWTLNVQILPDTEEAFDILGFDPLDTTKQWPPAAVPYEEVGRFVFNENPTSQFLENEQIAFSPSRMVPGVEPSDEKMLQTRLFSYADTQRYRLGVNNQNLPINKPRCPFYDGHVGGYMNTALSEDDVNYFPSSIRTNVKEAPKYKHDPEHLSGEKTREMIPLTDDYAQAGERWRSFDKARRDRFVMRTASALSGDSLPQAIVDTWLGYWEKADKDLAAEIKKNLTLLRAHREDPAKVEAWIATEGGAAGRVVDFAEDFFRAAGARP